ENVSQKVQVKWPNDILAEGRKICGILIENHISGDEITHAIVGIGLNLNQVSFGVPTAGSLRLLTGLEYRPAAVFSRLMTHLETRYAQLGRGDGVLEQQYLRLLYRKDEIHTFRSGFKDFKGIITGVNEAGQLVVTVGSEQKCFGVKELTYL